jgi:four helix bundle protein
MVVRSFRDLIAWQKGMELGEAVYSLTRTFPSDERFGLTLQVRRAAVSIPSNIAEGQARKTTPDFIRFLRIAQGSLAEVATQVQIAHRLSFVSDNTAYEDLLRDAESLERILHALIRSLETKSRPPDRTS